MKTMRRLPLVLTALLFFTAALPALADNNLSYDDPSVHYTAPDGWTRLDVPAANPENSSEETPVAVFQKAFGRIDNRIITLRIGRYEGSLDGLESTHENDLRSGGQSVFVEKKTKVTMPNGMPAWQIKYSSGEDVGQSVRAFDVVVYDGRRSIILTYAGRTASFSDDDALKALSSLTVVLYPEGR